MDRFYTTLLGTYRGHDYYLTVSGEPSINDVQAFAVTIHYDDPQTRGTIEIARIDTSHGYIHFDRLYRADQPKGPPRYGDTMGGRRKSPRSLAPVR